jgi:hypothetical protein
LPESVSETVKAAAEIYRIEVQSWWQKHR